MIRAKNCTVHVDGDYWVWKDDSAFFPFVVRRGLNYPYCDIVSVAATRRGAIRIIKKDKRKGYHGHPDPTRTCASIRGGDQ